MEYTLYWEVDQFEDSMKIKGDNTNEIKIKIDEEVKKRGLDIEKNNVWSMEN